MSINKNVLLHEPFNFLTGEDLLAIAADQPFQFPATFTFVRAFSVLDGINLERALTLDLILLRLPNPMRWSC
ncbi:hypothetical protein CIPAW_08G171300 [Carya illinoinensis]|uniref:Uncharacterized protein n=1 Tax=Carya illinoinensis TaxID=32201 RepID=A0A8T1PXG8_CARIL|nr:hypothetical protein CIPAW_08G171300 [Carya illinoinensis]